MLFRSNIRKKIFLYSQFNPFWQNKILWERAVTSSIAEISFINKSGEKAEEKTAFKEEYKFEVFDRLRNFVESMKGFDIPKDDILHRLT